MTSWFSSAALPLSLGETLNGLKDKVQAKVNSIDPDLIKKLTLQSDELLAERQQIDDEERRKEAVRDSLSEILPWDTRDAEMEILVDECREVILGLSSKHETFTGPFVLEGGAVRHRKGRGGGRRRGRRRRENGQGRGGRGGVGGEAIEVATTPRAPRVLRS